MSIKQNKKGYYIQDNKGTIHARHIPDIKTAKELFKQIKWAREGL